MLMSIFVQWKFPQAERSNYYRNELVVKSGETDVNLSFYHFSNDSTDESVIFLPDEIAGGRELIPLAEELQNYLNVYVINYPDRGMNGDRISYSVESRAEMLRSFIKDSGIKSAHLAARGYGGLIAVHFLADNQNSLSLKSLSLLSSYGPVEFHLLGNETINRSMYNFLYPVSFLFRYGVPHFGWFHHQNLQNKHIRAFSEMEQGEFRIQAENIELPVHILHPLKQHSISYQTSLEIHRLIPQSTFAVSAAEGQNFFEFPVIWADQLQWFWGLVNNGEAKTRAEAPADRVQFSHEPFHADSVDSYTGWALALIIVIIIILSFVNEDLTSISAGLLVAGGVLDLHFAIVACFIGILCTDSFAYYLGSRVGRPIFQKKPFKWLIDESDIIRVENLLKMHGMKLIFLTRFLPGTRLPTHIAAGMLRTDVKKFLIYFVLAIMVWAPLIVSLSAFLGRPMLQYLSTYQDYALIIIPAIILILYSLLKLILPLATIRGRRRLIVKLGRFKERLFG